MLSLNNAFGDKDLKNFEKKIINFLFSLIKRGGGDSTPHHLNFLIFNIHSKKDKNEKRKME